MVNFNEEELNKKVENLIELLIKENKSLSIDDYDFEKMTYSQKKDLFNSLCLSRKPSPLKPEFLKIQNELLSYENKKKKIINVDSLDYINNMSICVGDIVSLQADAIVCSCRDNLIGNIESPEDNICNDIILAGGLQVRQELNFIISKQNHNEQLGQAKVIKGYNLPAEYIICTVGPKVINGRVGYREKEALVNCYNSCLNAAYDKKLKTIAFCCISTGSNRFPKELASEIAISTVSAWLKSKNYPLKVVFCLENDDSKEYYETNFKYYA